MKKLLFVYIIMFMSFSSNLFSYKIIPLTPGLTEILCALGESGNIVAVPDNVSYPETIVDLPKIGPFFRPNVEKILSLNPDIVIGVKFQRQFLDRLEKLGIKTVVVNDHSVEELLASVKVIAETVRKKKKGESIVRKWKECLDSLKNRRSGTKKVLLVVGHYKNGVFSASKGTFLSELSEYAGGENIVSSEIAYPRLNLENIVSLKPDIIIDTSCKNEKKFYDELRKFINFKLEKVNDKFITIPGPRIFKTLEKFYLLLNDKKINLEKCLK